MKRSLGVGILVCALFFSLSSPAAATQATVETRLLTTETQLELSENLFITTSISGPFGGFVQVFGSRSWAELYGGLTLQPGPWLQIGLGVGVEQNDKPIRVGGFFWIGDNVNYFTRTELEKGGSGVWYQSLGAYRPVSWFGAGYFLRKGEGLGPYVEVLMPKPKLKFWAAPLILDLDTQTIFFKGISSGASITF